MIWLRAPRTVILNGFRAPAGNKQAVGIFRFRHATVSLLPRPTTNHVALTLPGPYHVEDEQRVRTTGHDGFNVACGDSGRPCLNRVLCGDWCFCLYHRFTRLLEEAILTYDAAGLPQQFAEFACKSPELGLGRERSRADIAVAQERRRPDRLAGAAHQVAAQRHPAPVGSSGRKRGAGRLYVRPGVSPRHRPIRTSSCPLRERQNAQPIRAAGESNPVRHADRFPGCRNRSARQHRCRFNRECRGYAPQVASVPGIATVTTALVMRYHL